MHSVPCFCSVVEGGEAVPNQHLQSTYDQLCQSYRAIDDMRMKLLGALPLATGTGIFLLLNKDLADPNAASLLKGYLPAIGIFGFLVTFGLALYEVYGIRKCQALIETGKAIEVQLDVPGQFLTRPGPLLRFVSEPLAGGFIYPAVLAAWTFVGLYSWPTRKSWAVHVFCFGLVFSLLYNFIFRNWRPPNLDEWVEKHPTNRPTSGNGGAAQHSPADDPGSVLPAERN